MYIAHNCIWEKKTLKFRVMICIGEGRMGGWVIFFLMYEDTVFLELWLGYTRMLGHALCHLCFPSIVSCDHDSIPKAKLPSKKEHEKKKEQKTNVHCAAPDSLWPVCFSKWEIIYVDFLLTFNLYSMIQANKRSTQDIT